MAETTVTTSSALKGGLNSTAVEVHAGTVTVPFAWTAAGASISTSSLIMLVRIPHGAVITNLQMSAWAAMTTGTIDVGLNGQGSADAIVDGGAMGSTQTDVQTIRTGALPMTCSVTDDSPTRWRYLQAKVVTGTSTGTAILRGAVTYVCGTGRGGL